MLTIRSDSLHPRPLQSLPAQVLAGEHLRPLDRAESGRSACQSLTKILAKTPPAMSIHPTGNPPPQARLQYNSRPIKRPSPTGTATDYLICRVNSLNRPPIVSESSSSLTVWADKLDRSANLFDFTSHLAYTNHPRLFCYSQSFIMIPQPNRDQALLRSFLSNLAKSCYWSSLIRPLVFLILACQLKHSQLLDRSSAKLLDQLDFFFHKLFKQICPSPLPPPTKSPKPFSAPPPPKRLRAARGFRCSALVDSSDSSILHEHQPSPFHLNRSSACRTVPRTDIFIRSSSTPPTPLEVHRLAARAQSQMERSPYYAAEDCLDGDQRQQRYYLVNAYRAKLASDCSAVLTEYSSPTWQPCEMGIDADEDELEPLEDLLEWDSSTRLN